MSGISEVDLKDFEQVKIKVLEVDEKENGDAMATIEFNAAGLRLLVNFGFNEILRQAIKHKEQKNDAS